MKILVDTHAFLWFVQGDRRLHEPVRLAIEDPTNDKLVSVASVWEIAIKEAVGKLRFPEPLAIFLARELVGFQLHPISLAHAVAVATLPLHHRDPFDRMMAVQSLQDELPLVSNDKVFNAYGVERFWDDWNSA